MKSLYHACSLYPRLTWRLRQLEGSHLTVLLRLAGIQDGYERAQSHSAAQATATRPAVPLSPGLWYATSRLSAPSLLMIHLRECLGLYWMFDCLRRLTVFLYGRIHGGFRHPRAQLQQLHSHLVLAKGVGGPRNTHLPEARTPQGEGGTNQVCRFTDV